MYWKRYVETCCNSPTSERLTVAFAMYRYSANMTNPRAALDAVRAQWQEVALLVIAAAAAVMLRWFLRVAFTSDYTEYMRGWIVTLREGGYFALGSEFSNYNLPYLYLLLIGAQLPLEGLTIVKLISAVFDVVLAAGVAAIVYQLSRRWILAATIGIGVLFVPEVFLNSAVWGQTDSIYTAFLVWSAYFVVTRRDVLAWVMFAIAFEFKLQAIFLLPWIALAFVIQKHRFRTLLYAVGVIIVLSIPGIIAGRPPLSILEIYAGQTGTGILAQHVANPYAWINQDTAAFVNPAGVALAVGIVALLCVAYLRRPPTDIGLLQVAATFAAVIPFALPQMHDRYFYPAGIFAILCILIDRRYVLPAALFQFTAVTAYALAVFRQEPVLSYPLLAVVQLVPVAMTVYLSFARPATTQADRQEEPAMTMARA